MARPITTRPRIKTITKDTSAYGTRFELWKAESYRADSSGSYFIRYGEEKLDRKAEFLFVELPFETHSLDKALRLYREEIASNGGFASPEEHYSRFPEKLEHQKEVVWVNRAHLGTKENKERVQIGYRVLPPEEHLMSEYERWSLTPLFVEIAKTKEGIEIGELIEDVAFTFPLGDSGEDPPEDHNIEENQKLYRSGDDVYFLGKFVGAIPERAEQEDELDE